MRKQKKNAIKRTMKRVAAFTGSAVAVVLCVSLVVSSIWNDSIDAQAGDTLLGIEKLRLQVADSGKEYTVLEIVPNKNSAEIGFLVDGCEPILGEWDEDGNWVYWKEALFKCDDNEEARRKYVEGLKDELKAYYEKTGSKWGKDYPVYGESDKYAESKEPKDGYEEISAPKDTRNGYFEFGGKDAKYQIAFEHLGRNVSKDPKTLYYKVKEDSVKEITQELSDLIGSEGAGDDSVNYEEELKNLLKELESYPDDMYVYTTSGTGAQMVYEPHPWAQAKDDCIEQVKKAYEQLAEAASIEEIEEEEEEEENVDEAEEEEENVGEEDEDKEENTEEEDKEENTEEKDKEEENTEEGNKEEENTEEGNKEEENTEEGNKEEENTEKENKETKKTENGDEAKAKNNAIVNKSVRLISSKGKWLKMVAVKEVDNKVSSDDGSGSDNESGSGSGNESESDSGNGSDSGNESESDSGNGSDSGNESESGSGNGSDSGNDNESGSGDESDSGNDNESGSDDETDSDEGKNANSGTVSPTTVSGNSYKKELTNEDVNYTKYYIVGFERIEGYTDSIQLYYVKNPYEIRESSSDKYAYSFIEVKKDDAEASNDKSAKNGAEDSDDQPAADDEEDSDDKPATDDEEDSDDKPAADDAEDSDDTTVTDDTEDSDDATVTDDTEDSDDAAVADDEEKTNTETIADSAKFVKYVDVTDDKAGSEDKTEEEPKDETQEDSKDETKEEPKDETKEEPKDETKDESKDETKEDSEDETEKNPEDETEENPEEDSEDESEDSSDDESAEDSNNKNVTYAEENPGNNTGNNPEAQEYTFLGKTIYCKNTFKSNEWFKRYVLNMDEGEFDKFSINVITLTPEELNVMETLPVFDFLYLNSGLRVISDDSSTGEGDGNGADGEEGSAAKPKSYVGENDLNDKVLQYLVSRIVAGARPCLVDGTILYAKEGSEDSEAKAIKINEELKSTNIFRIAAIMCQDSLEEWYEKNSGNLKGVSVNNLIDGIVEDADKNFVTEQVYCRFDDVSIINKDFHTATIYRDGGEMDQGFQKVLDEILLDNAYREADSSGNYKALSTDIGQSTAVRHIISYQNRRKVEPKEKIKVLEIQPAKADSPELTLEQLQAWAPGVKEAEITVMTTAEFIGKIEKLNETYDLIYIGTCDDHLNVKYWDYQTPNSNTLGSPSQSKKVSAGTVFNDSNMDGLIYYNIGDLRAATVFLAGQLDTEYVNPNDRNGDVFNYNYFRYGGNDITNEKKEALLSFLNGSYPVIVSDDFIEQPVTVFQDADYKGARVSLSEGEYTREDLDKLGGVLALDVSSIKVKEGYKITIFDGNKNFTGNSLTLDKNTNDLKLFKRDGKNNWNNCTYSAIVERVEDKTPVRRIDEDHIDNCTYLYDFVKAAMEKDYVNFYAWSDIEDDSELFKFYLNRPKVSVQQTFVNGERKNDSGSEIYYIGPGNDGRYRLEYHFVIHNEGAASANSRYLCRLYIDINSDGKFSAEEEVPDINVMQGGGLVSADGLYIDREYVLTRGVPDGYKGLLPWKVEITQADNDNIYASMSGYTKLDGMEKERIDVIQIKRSNTTWTWAGDPIDLEREFGNENTIYHALVYGGVIDGVEYKGISDDYDINVDCMTIAEYEDMYNENPDCMNAYNMLILGFSDMYESFSGDSEIGPMSGIVDFINSGKSVLFAHDTTSYVNYSRYGIMGHVDRTNPSSTAGAVTGADDFALSLNKYVRGLVGMDRYGILSANGSILRAGQVLQKGNSDYDTIVSSGKDVAYEPKSNRERTVPQVHGYTYHTINAKDKNYNGGPQIKEFTRAELDLSLEGTFSNTFRNIRYNRVYYDGGGWDDPTEYGDLQYTWNGAINEMNVTQVNKGQITEYPYHLPEKFAIATTHGQYYELDFTADDDGDGQSDLVVWYCLSDRNAYSAGHIDTIYSESPNDVRNNYYIYNKGNVTYTGMGHSAGSSQPYTVDEAKLFINTIIAAYQAGVKQPYITVLKSGLSESAELKMMYRYYDTSFSSTSESLDYLATPEEYEKIYFKVQDLNFVKGTRSIATHVFYKADDGTEAITVEGEQVTVNRLPDYIFNAADGSPADPNNLKSNGIYYIMVQKSVLEQCDEGLDLYFEAQTTITPNTVSQKVYVTDKVYAKLKVLKAFLFDLE